MDDFMAGPQCEESELCQAGELLYLALQELTERWEYNEDEE